MARVIYWTHGNYITATRDVAAETKTLLIDMEAKTRKLVTELGPEKSKSLYVFCKPGECRRSSKGVQDSTHLNHYGAERVASLFVEGVKEQKLTMASLLK